ncbi:trehalose-6-phosphate synthase [Mucilaginibacter ginsenosidivorans]|uniref:Trehalose-6-phosphate synthase n=1 Tax=Mucilaginibacter ginsenosidivorans TaxID=398053 RepID=A0A5B8UYC3_9SPHI|nr:trehalose-6-phosphate synthase [Mucilaginibacter ginsenosidivorans]QEC63705.1 trehalose-6-phosphate synthase [Mucilaginibacter ginsenosidivorans]
MEIKAKAGIDYKKLVLGFCTEHSIPNLWEVQQSRESIDGYVTVRVNQPFAKKMTESDLEKISQFLQTLRA